MKKDCGARELATDLTKRSSCKVQVAAVLSDKRGIFAWGWNNSGSGLGMCAEKYAIIRANPKRLSGATLTITARRKSNDNSVFCQPCEDCFNLAKKRGVEIIEHTDEKGNWIFFQLKYAKLNLKKLKKGQKS